MRESRNVGFGRVRDRITKIIPGNRKLMYQGGSIELIKIKAVFHFWTHFRKNLEVGNPWAGLVLGLLRNPSFSVVGTQIMEIPY